MMDPAIGWIDIACCAFGAAGLAQLWTRVEGGPGAWVRDRIAAPALGAVGLETLTRCAFCVSPWAGAMLVGVWSLDHQAARMIGVVCAAPALLWLAGEAPRRQVKDEAGNAISPCAAKAAAKKQAAAAAKAQEESAAACPVEAAATGVEAAQPTAT